MLDNYSYLAITGQDRRIILFNGWGRSVGLNPDLIDF